jgi:hypothetical protein
MPRLWNEWHPALALRLVALALLAVAALGCGRSFRAASLTQPVSMSPMVDPIVAVQVGHVMLTDDAFASGMGDGTALAVELGVTNAGREPFTISAASFSCWLELSPDRPGETLSLTPTGGGEGGLPDHLAFDDMSLASTIIPPGQHTLYWVVFRGYRYSSSDVPRRITVSLPDPRGRRIQLVIADPARGDLRWEIQPTTSGITYGVQNSALLAPGLTATAVSAQISRVARAGPILWEVGLSTRVMVQTEGRLTPAASAGPTTFSGTGVTAHVTWPVLRWGGWQDPRWFGLFAGGEAQLLAAIEKPPAEGEMMKTPTVHGTLAPEGGVELNIGAIRTAANPFPLSFTAPGLFRWSFRFGYTHLFAGGLNSGGYVTSLRLAW